MSTTRPLLLLALAACSGGGAGGSGSDGATTDGTGGDGALASEMAYVSGSRLRANVLRTGEGASVFQDWHDATLGFDCRFGTATDGRTRCLPTGDVASAVSYFLDAACAQPLGVVTASSACGPAPSHVLYRDETACPVTTAVHVAGAVVSPLPDKIFIRNAATGACGEINPSATSTYYRLGAEVVPATLAEATLAPTEAAPRLVPMTLVGEDGSRTPQTTAWDNERAADCAFGTASDGVTRCLPAGAATDWGYHTNAACTAPVIQLAANLCGGPPATSRDYVPVDCVQGQRFHTLEAATPIASLYELSGTACAAAIIDEGYAYYPRGEELPAASFLAGTSEEEETGGRLVARYTAGGSYRRLRTWHDVVLDEDCAFTRASDGATRCLPSGASVRETFTNATCTTQRLLIEVRPGPDGCATTTPRYARWTDTTCPTSARLFEVGDAVVPTTIYTKSGASCTASTPSAGSSYYVAGPEIVPTELAKGTRVTD